MRPAPVVSMRGISKTFPGVQANDRVDLDIYRGEVHALVGENGAGKSTLMKVLYGFYRADAGEIAVEGQPTEIRSPEDARRRHIGMVFQDFVQIPALSVAENIALFLPDLTPILNRAEIVRRIETTARGHGLDVDPSAPVWRLSVGERQKVEVLKLLLADARVLILDEPTRSLAPHEIEALFRTLDSLCRDGLAVVLITHKLREVLACAHRVTVMRRGRVAGMLPRAAATESGLVSMMFGGAVAEPRPRPRERRPAAVPLLELRRVSTQVEGQATALEEVDLTVEPGEIVGVAGVSGNGQRELGDVILGLVPCARGVKYLWGLDATRWSAARTRRSGVAFIPEEAREMAAVAGMTVLENMALGDTRRYARAGGLAIDWRAVRSDLEGVLARLEMTLPSLDMPAGGLSGGNVQRMILAREVAHGPGLIVAFNPTRGLDVRSAVAARGELVAARDGGVGVLLISEDLDELFSLSDRLVVLFHGRIVATATPHTITGEAIGYLMTGTTPP